MGMLGAGVLGTIGGVVDGLLGNPILAARQWDTFRKSLDGMDLTPDEKAAASAGGAGALKAILTAKQRQQQDLARAQGVERLDRLGAFGGQGPSVQVRAPDGSMQGGGPALPAQVPNFRDLAPVLGQMAAKGVDTTDLTTILDKAQPHIQFVNGVAVDDRDQGNVGKRIGVHLSNVNGFQVDDQNPNNEGKYYGEAPAKGAEPAYNQRGEQIGWHMADGSLQAIAAAKNAETAGQKAAELQYAGPIAGATTSATERAKAPYTFLTPNVGGVPTLMTAEQAAAATGTPGAQLGPVALGGWVGGQPRGIRNNNPGNLRPLPKGQWAGQSGVDGGDYAQFSSPEAGIAAADQNLLAKQTRHGLNTLDDIIAKPGVGWDPGNHGYAATVAQSLGIRPTDPVNLTDPAVRQKVLSAIFQVENGRPVAANTPASAPVAQLPQLPRLPGAVGLRGVNPDDLKRVQTLRAEADRQAQVAGLANDFMKVNANNATGPAYSPVKVPMLGNINPIHGVSAAINPDIAAMESITSRAAPQLRPEGSGRIMQNEYNQFLKAFPNIQNLGKANQQITGQLQSEAQTRRNYADFMSNWLAQNGSLAGADEAWAKRSRQAVPASASPRTSMADPLGIR